MTEHQDGAPGAERPVDPDRRNFLKGTLAGAAAMSLGSNAADPLAADQASPTLPTAPVENYDVVIVGGGVAGCYVAYRLLNGTYEDNSPLPIATLKVGLFEYAGRVGGRDYR